MKIIPAIDLIDGKCVRLEKGDYNTKKIYSEDPLEVARAFEDHGIKFLHVVDLDGAKSKQIVNYKTLARITAGTNLVVDFGGGIKSTRDVEIAFDNGASKITGGSIAALDPELFLNWLENYGKDRIILGADCKNRMIATNGWMQSHARDVVDFIEDYAQKGIKEVICTDISKDGMLNGPSTGLYEEVLSRTPVELIGSGGVSSIQDLKDLASIGCAGAIVGKAIYEKKISLEKLSELC